MRAFVQALRGQHAPLTHAEDALESHILGFTAEAARLGEVSVVLEKVKQGFGM
jgi:hypothetical protein